MDKIEEVLPRISEYLTKDLAREKLSPLAEATRLFYVERIKSFVDPKHENGNSLSQVKMLKNLIGKKIGDKLNETPEMKNGYVKQESHAILNDSHVLIIPPYNDKTIDSCSLNESVEMERIAECYDSEFDSSEDEKSFPTAEISPDDSYHEELFSLATFKGVFFQNILLKMRKRTCYIVGSELVCTSRSKVRSRFSVVNCRTSMKQHDSKYLMEVRLEPAPVYSLSSFYTTDSQLAWRFVKAIKDAGGAVNNKDDKRVSSKDLDQQSTSTQSSENQNLEVEKTDLASDNLKAKVQNFFGTMGKKKGRQVKKILAENDSNIESLVSGFVKLLNKSLSSRWHKMYCYINDGYFYAKKGPSDDHLEMATPLSGAVIGLPRKDSTKDFKIKIIQKDTKFMIELGEMFEHARWIQIFMKETQAGPDKPTGIIYFENIGESTADDFLKDDNTDVSHSIYANHSEILALMCSPTRLNESSTIKPVPLVATERPVTPNTSNTSIAPTPKTINCRPGTPHTEEFTNTGQLDSKNNSKVKKAPPVAAKPKYPIRAGKPEMEAILDNKDTLDENGIYSVVKKNTNKNKVDEGGVIVASPDDDRPVPVALTNDGVVENASNVADTPEDSAMPNGPLYGAKHAGLKSEYVNGNAAHHYTKQPGKVCPKPINNSPKPKPFRAKPLSSSQTNLSSHENGYEDETRGGDHTRKNKKNDTRVLSVDDADLRATKLRPVAHHNRRSMFYEKIMHFESEDEC